ncbi:MAG: DEAD/DEAH box helicase family protein [Cyanobacteriota/Melainabacteria group bacterium]
MTELTNIDDAALSWLDNLAFQYPLRKYQKQIIELCKKKIEAGEKELHIVAPPGSGKTILGYEIISQFKCPSLVLCPNNTIATQWNAKLEDFFSADDIDFARPEVLGGYLDRPLKPITIMTYQALSLPGREKEYLTTLAKKEWISELTGGITPKRAEAEIRLLDLEKNNPKEFNKELRRHVSRLRRRLVDVLDLNEVLHENALDLMQALKRRGVGLVVFDECHHLTDYWAAVMIHLVKHLEPVTVVGLTGTPPDSASGKQKNRYLNLVGEIDYQVPTPALVKEGGLAPYQDLAFFTEPTKDELEFLKESHKEIHQLLLELKPDAGLRGEDFSSYICNRIEERKENPQYLMAASRYLFTGRVKLPGSITLSKADAVRQSPLLDDWIELLEDYALNHLKVSAREEDLEFYSRIKEAIKKIGYSLTERGIRKLASSVDRILAYSKSKALAVQEILDTEYGYLDDRLRALVITDFEKMSATSSKSLIRLKEIMNAESGGAAGVFKELLAGANLNKSCINYPPCLVTGSVLMVDSRIRDQYLQAACDYLKERELEITLETESDENYGYTRIFSSSGQWRAKLYVALATELFARGISKCMIGTRGIFGEGWDCQELNTIIDLTTSTSSVAVNQLRGRGIRLNTVDSLAERKVANNWDVICIAPALEKGLNDYFRFVRKHRGYFGIADDGQIECGVGHVHPQFSELTPQEVFASFNDFNFDMLNRATRREEAYTLWKVGEPYRNQEIACVEIARVEERKFRPLQIAKASNYQEHCVKTRKDLIKGECYTYAAYFGMGAPISIFLSAIVHLPFVIAIAPVLLTLYFATDFLRKQRIKLGHSLNRSLSQEESFKTMATALLDSLIERRFLPETIERSYIKVSRRKDGFYRIFLDGDDCALEHSDLFMECYEEMLAPLSDQKWLMPRYELTLPDDLPPQKFLDLYISGKAEPKIVAYHAVPRILARSEAGRDAFEYAWNQHVSPGFLVDTEKQPEILSQYFGSNSNMSLNIAERLLWG